MTKLDDRLRGLDKVAVPDVWRLAHNRVPQYPVESARHLGRAVAVVAAFAIALGSFAILQRTFRQGSEPRRPTPAATGIIAFVTQGPMQQEIEIVRTDGSGLRLLGVGQNPAWSPDGSEIAFDRYTAQGTGIYVMAADGSNVRRLTHNADGTDEEPDWSPDGTQIAFTRGSSVGPRDVFVMSVDGGDARRLTAAVSDDFAPSWSPDGSRIAFIRVPDGTIEAAKGPATHRNQVWTMASDGRDEQRITEISSGAFRPAWSPAGDVIAFDAGQRLWLVHPDGSGLVQVAGTTALGGYAAAWSPDGASLLFGGHEPGKVEGQVVFETSPPDGSPRSVVKLPTGASLPAWRPSPPSLSPAPVPQGFVAFVPPTRTVDGKVLLPATFPDGSTAELSYPPSLDLAGLGVRPYVAGCGGDFGFFHYDPYGSVYEGDPIQTWTGSDGQSVGLWAGVQGTGPLNHLIWHFGEWTVEKYEYRDAGSTPEQLATCAEGLRATVTDDGWIVLDGPSDIRLTRGFGPNGGAELEFGGLQPRRFVLMWPGPCHDIGGTTVINGVAVDLSKDFASWCDPGGQMRIHVYFEPGSSFFRDVFDGLTVQEVRLASRNG